MIDLARSRGLMLSLFHNRRWDISGGWARWTGDPDRADWACPHGKALKSMQTSDNPGNARFDDRLSSTPEESIKRGILLALRQLKLKRLLALLLLGLVLYPSPILQIIGNVIQAFTP